jgi:O-antigen ligase
LAATDALRPLPGRPAGVPWLTLLLATAFSFFAASVAAPGAAAEGGNVTTSILVLAVGAVLAYLRPAFALHLFLAAYVPLYLLSFSGLVGNAIVAYLSVLVVLAYAARVLALRGSVAALPATSLAAALAALAALQWLRSADHGSSLHILCHMVAFAAALWVLPRMTDGALRDGATAYVMGALGVAVALVAQRGSGVRLGFEHGVNPNVIALSIGLGLLFLFSRTVFPRASWLPLAAGPPLFIALLLTQSRTALFATILCLGLILLLEKRRFYLLAALAGVAVFAYVLFLTEHTPFDIWHRFSSVFTADFVQTGAQRAFIWSFLLSQVQSYWLFGIGLNNTPLLTTNASHIAVKGLGAHNIYLTFFVEYGIAGLALLLAWQYRILRAALARVRSAPLMLPVFLYFVLTGFFFTFNLSMLMAFALVAGYRLAPPPRAARPAPAA